MRASLCLRFLLPYCQNAEIELTSYSSEQVQCSYMMLTHLAASRYHSSQHQERQYRAHGRDIALSPASLDM
jgi:hypothetical protein